MSHYYLGDELAVAGILSWLPVKSLLRFRCVSKSWNSLISYLYFISSQLCNSRANNTQALVHQWEWCIRAGGQAAIRLLHVEDNRDQSLLLDFGFESPNVHLYVIGSAGGLICYIGLQGPQSLISKFIVFNPEIRSFLSVPPPLPSFKYSPMIKGFGLDDTTLDYKFFLAKGAGDVYLYSLNSNSWKSISFQISWNTIAGDYAVFMKDCFHWVTYGNFQYPYPTGTYPDHGTYITVFDIKSETFRRILFPERFLGQVRVIAGFDESSIGAVQTLDRERSTITHVWLMDQSGSWFKVADNIKIDKYSEVLGFRNKDGLIIRLHGSDSIRVIVLQNIKNEVVHDVMSGVTKVLSL